MDEYEFVENYEFSDFIKMQSVQKSQMLYCVYSYIITLNGAYCYIVQAYK